MIKQYNKQIEEHQKLIKGNDMVSTWIGFIKLGIVIVIIFSLYKSITTTNNFMYILFGAIIFFVIFTIWQSNVKKKIRLSRNAITIYQKHIDRITGDWISFERTGEEYLEPDHIYAGDLDIVGKKSLFQLLNVTNTYHGEKRFIEDLLHPKYEIQEINERQNAVQELSNNISFVNTIEQKTLEIGTDDKILKIINILNNRETMKISSLFQNVIYCIPPIATISFIIGLYFKVLPLVIVGLGTLIIQGALWIITLPKLQNTLQMIRKVPFGLKEYTTLFSYICEQNFTSNKLKDIQNTIGNNTLSSTNAMKDLEKIINMISVGNNFIIYGILNIFLLWDFLCYIRFQRWQEKYADNCENWFEGLGELESIMSFSILPMVSNHAVMPNIIDNERRIDVTELGHPLLHESKRINNDFSLHNEICIISGSNMSGKTTFMRTLGINLLLARIGSFVCAKSMDTAVFNLAASMRITDNLNEGISTFYAELKNIKSILDIAKEEENTFFMIDEIFRGTNSRNRLEGAQTVLKKLYEMHISGIITTHDLELCQLQEQYDKIENYHFTETYKDNEIVFNYQLKKGVSTTTNAKELMRMVGIM
ncbi:MAG: MutS-related protein [Coprobacillaceae bacterium]